MTPTPAAPAAMSDERLAEIDAYIADLLRLRDGGGLAVCVRELRAEIDRLRAATRATHQLATALHRALQQDADSGDFGRGLDDRVTLAADLRLKLEMHTEPAP